MTQSIEAKLLSVLIASVLASYAIVASTTAPVVLASQEDREQGEHGSASSDETGGPQDPNHWGDSASDFGDAGIMGDHSREGSAPGDAPFDERDDTEGRIGVGNNVGDGPSGHGACVDGDPETEDPDCPGA
jgi:hypothetical protein